MRSKESKNLLPTSDIPCKDSNLGSSMHQKQKEPLISPSVWTSVDQEEKSPAAVVTPIYQTKMDTRRGRSSDRGKSSRSSSAYAGADYQDKEEDYRQAQHEGYQCQHCGSTFISRNDLMHHVHTECRFRYYGYQQRHDPYAAARMPTTQSNIYMSHAGERAAASRTALDMFDSTNVTPVLQPQQQHYMRGITGSGEFHRSRPSRSPSSPQVKRSPTGAQDIVERPQELIRLLTPEELDSLSPQDRALCRSVALFCSKGPSSSAEAGTPWKSRSTSPGQDPSTQPFDSPPRAGQVKGSRSHSEAEAELLGHSDILVGFQCIYCASDHKKHEKGGEAFSRVFPGSIETIAASLNLVKERHFLSPPRTGRKSDTPSPTGGQGGCLHMPSNIRKVFEAARGQASFKSRESAYDETMALQRACQNLAVRFGIDNKLPHKTGIILQQDRPIPGVGHDLTHPDFESGALHHPFDRRPTRREASTFGYGTAIEPGDSVSSRYAPNPSHEYESGAKDVSFIRDAYGWCCPHCSSLPYNFRAPGYFSREEPSPGFMDRHFAVCTGLSNEERGAEPRARTPHSTSVPYAPRHIYSPGPYDRSLLASGRARPPAYYPAASEPMDFGHGQLAAQHYRSHSHHASEIPREATDDSVRQAVEFLESLEEESPDEGPLVLPDDKLLLTDYFFYLNKQLKQCRFTEKDRKTRGGKREKIELGFGGLQCRHCAETSNSRKFFWSDVDRLANSFAEIPGHILKCRKCPDEVKNALIELKLKHPEQMARLPRGSQKVFFRRMWKRLHKKDSDLGSKASSPKEGGHPSIDPQSSGELEGKSSKRPAEDYEGEGEAKKPRSDFYAPPEDSLE